MTHWYEGPLASFDTETTGVDVESDRIVTAALVTQDSGGAPVVRRDWAADPGVPIPAGATAVHGLTDEWARLHGRPARLVVEEIAQALAESARAGLPLVIMNAPYDLTLLDRELRRHRGLTLGQYLTGAPLSVLDPRVLDKHLDRYRKGRRRLTDLCEHYGVGLDEAHDAAADATAAMELVRAIGRRGDCRSGSPAAAPPRWSTPRGRSVATWTRRPDGRSDFRRAQCWVRTSDLSGVNGALSH
jgi:DNA polymerase-3 subunit epsilon